MKNLVYLLLGAMMLFTISSCLDNKHGKNYNATIDDEGSTFIRKGLEAGLTEIKASKIAETNSKNSRIISFAKMMIADHGEAGDELEKIAIKKRVTGGDSVSTEHQKNIDDIATKSGAAFDRAYIQMMVNDHQEAVKLFTGATIDRTADIQNFAKKVLPTLKMHLDSANAICASLK
jgi:putative membrane protein